jgi:hypothetical protein
MRGRTPAEKLRDHEAEWMTKATHSAIEGVREAMASINGRAMLSSLSELELGWMAMGAVFNWIKTKSEQAVAEGVGYDEVIRAIDRFPPPWEVGAITSILPALGEIEDVPWNKPVAEWSRDQIIMFAWHVHKLVQMAMVARDVGEKDKLTQNIERSERELSAAHGGPLLSRKEMDDKIPF